MKKFEIEEIVFKDVKLIKPKVFEDERGFFLEVFNTEEFKKLGIDELFVQDNHSKSKRGVLRGLHFQTKHSQGKLVRVIKGAIYDVVVDIRKNSSTYGEWYGVELDSKDRKIISGPVYIINANEVNQTPSMVVNILSGEILGFKYIDLFNRNLNEILRDKGMKEKANTISEYDEWLISLNKSNINEYFELDKENKIIRYLPIRLKDGIHVNNEPYWFVLKAYASFYLASKEGYKCDMSSFNMLQRGNKTLDAFRDYIKKFG